MGNRKNKTKRKVKEQTGHIPFVNGFLQQRGGGVSTIDSGPRLEKRI